MDHSKRNQTKSSFWRAGHSPNVVHIPPYIAKEMGFFAENNIDVEFVTFEGGTFTVSNLGMLVINSFIAIINPPNAPS